MSSNAELLKQSRSAVMETKGYQRVVSLFDAGTFNEVDSFAKSGEGYAEAVAGYGTINGCPAYAFAQNSDFDGGAMSKAQAAKIKKVYDLAVKTGAPVIGIFDSIGGRLKEGADMLAAYGEILLNANNLSGVVPQISLVLGPCVGTSAMIAAGADLVVMSDKGELTIATSGDNASPEDAVKSGVCQIAAESEDAAIAAVRELITILPSNNLCGTTIAEALSESGAVLTADSSVEEIVKAVADADSYIELSAGFGEAVNAGFAQVGGYAAGVVAYNGAVLDADSCSKAARLIRFCDAFAMPVVSFVNAAEFASLREATKLSNAYSEATTAKVTVITGEAYGPVYIAVAGRGANADYTMAWPDAVVSALCPQTAAMFLWNDRLAGSSDPVADRKKLVEEYKKTEASPFAAAAQGLIEDIINPEETREKVIANLEMLSGKRVSMLPKKHTNIQL